MKAFYFLQAFVAMYSASLLAATYCDFSSSTPSSLGSGWVVASAESSRGKALHGTQAGSDVSFNTEFGANPVFSFLAKNTASGEETLSVLVDGASVTNVVLGAEGTWTRHVVSLVGVDSGVHTIAWRIVVPGDGHTPNLWIDDVYAGRRLLSSSSIHSDVWSATDASEGVVELANGLYTGSWTTTKSSYYFWSNTTEGFFASTTAGLIGKTVNLLSCFPLEKAPSDAIIVSYELKRNTQGRPDSVCPFVSLDNGATQQFIGDFTINTNDVPLTQDGWIAATNVAIVAGLTGNGNILLGFQSMAGRGGLAGLTIRNISVTYKTLATPTIAGFATADGVITNGVFFGAETNYLGAEISATLDANITNVVLTHTRTGHSQPKTVTLSESATVPGLWLSDQTVGALWGDVLEAGEVNTFVVTNWYGSTANLQTESPDSQTFTTNVLGLGTVWLNEVFLSNSGWAELAAPTNRSVAGWSLQARQGDGAPVVLKTGISTAFDNENNRFGVGFAVVDNLSLSGLAPDVSTIFELVNSSGVVESTRTVESLDLAATYAATGELSPRDPDDWAAWTDAGEPFGWSATTNPTQGRVNEGVQGVLREVSLPLRFRSKNQNNVTIFIAAKFSEDPENPVTTQFVLSDDNPTVEVVGDITNKWYASEVVTLSGFDSRDALPSSAVEITASAFGYEGSAEPLSAYAIGDATHSNPEVNELTITMQSSVGVEAFDQGFEGTWIRGGDSAKLVWVSDEPKYMSTKTKTAVSSWRGATFTSVASMDATRGNRMVKFGVSVQATSRHINKTDWDTLRTSLLAADESGDEIPFLPLTDRYDTDVYSATDWVRTTQWLPLETDFADEYQLKFAVSAGGSSNGDLNFDDIYLSFQDYVAVTGLALEPLTPEAGVPLKATVAVDPGVGGATDVDVTIWTSLNGAEPIPAKVWHFDTLAAATNLVEADLLPLAGSGGDFVGVLNCWAEARYATRNGSRNPDYTHDFTYYPDNASTNGTIRFVEGEYTHGRIAWGVQRVWVNEINPNGTPFVELCGRAGEDIGGWTLAVSKPDGSESATYAIPAGTLLDSTTNNCGFYVFSGTSHTGFTLPTPCILRLLDAEDNVLYAYSFAASGPDPNPVDGFVNLGSAGGESLLASGEGNPANRGFTWTTGDASPGDNNEGAINDGQDLANAGPVAAKIEAAPASGGIVALSAGAVDLDNPVEYRFFVGDGNHEIHETHETPLGDWSAATTATATGLAQNTPYAYSVHTRDALEQEGSTASTNLYTLLDSWSVSAAGSATDAITLTATIDGLGTGDTAWSVVEPAECAVANLPTNAFTASSATWGPNTEHSFLLTACNGNGIPSATTNTVIAHTLAAVPGAMLSAEVVETEDGTYPVKIVLTNATDAACQAGNAADTEYSVRVTLSFKNAVPLSYIVNLENGADRTTGTWLVWDDFVALLADGEQPVQWLAQAGELGAQEIAFEVVARNSDGVETESRVDDDPPAPGVARTRFELSAKMTRDPTQRTDGSGYVDIEARFTNPAMQLCNARLEYSTDAGAHWATATIAEASAAYDAMAYGADASGYTLRSIATSSNATNTVALAWNAGADLPAQDYADGGVSFRWVAYDSVNTEASMAVTLPETRAAAPKLARPTASVTAPAFSPTNALVFTVTFNEAVSNLTKTAFTVQGGTVADVSAVAPSNGLATNWTIRVTPSNATAASLTVAITGIAASAAFDNYYNASQAWSGNVSAVYDGLAPTVTLTGLETPFKESDKPWVVTATFTEPVYGVAATDLQLVSGTAAITLASGVDGGTVFTFHVSPTADGDVQVKFKANEATDAAGNKNAAASNALTRTYDTTVPTVEFTVTPEAITNETSASFTATADDANKTKGLTLLWKLDNGAWTERPEQMSGFSWDFATLGTLADGSHTVSIKARDKAGNETATDKIKSHTWTVDTARPTVAFSATPASITNATSATFTATADDTNKAEGLTLLWKLDNGAWTERPEQTSGFSWEFTTLGTLADGSHTVSIKARDKAGNVTATEDIESYTWTVDTTAPSVSFSTTPASITNATSASFTATANDANKAEGLTLLWKLDNGAWTSALPGELTEGFSWNITATSLSVGSHTVSIKAMDKAGNVTATPATYNWTVDTTAPTVSFSTKPASITNATSFVFTATANDTNKTKGLTLFWKLDNGAWTAALPGELTEGFSWNFTVSSLSVGSHTVSIKAKDKAGNETSGSAIKAHTWTVDTTAPTVSFSSKPASITNATSADFTATASDANAAKGVKVQWKLDNGNWTQLAEQKSGFSWSFTASPLVHGDHTVTVQASDKAGNVSSETSYTWSVDTTEPTVAFTATPTSITNATSFTFEATATAGDAYAANGIALFWKLNEGNWNGLTEKTADFTWSFPVDGFVEGTNTVSIKARDKAGNETDTEDIRAYSWVKDTVAPVLSLTDTPANPTSAGDFAIGIEANEDVSLSWNVAGTGFSGTAPIGAGPWTAQGSGLGEGTNTFTATATDAAGNATTSNYTWRITRDKPAVTIERAAALVQGDTATFTVRFGEAVSGFEQNDLTVLGGTVVPDSFKSVAATAPSVAYEVQVQATRPGTTVGLAVAEHVCTNALGIGNAAAGPVTCEVDYTAPVIGPLSVSPLRAKTGDQVTYSFDVTDVNLDTVTVANQSVAAADPSAAGVTHSTFKTTAVSNATFTIVATDAAGYSTTNNVASPLVIDDIAPTVAWSGLPDNGATTNATIVIATLYSVSDEPTTKQDPNIRVAWKFDNEAETEGWASTNSPIKAQSGALAADNHTFSWYAWDTAGNTSETNTVSWTVSGIPEPVVGEIGATVSDTTNVVFTIPGDATGATMWFRTNNVALGKVSEPAFNAGTTTVTVAISARGETNTWVELVVPAGTMGNTNEWTSGSVKVDPVPLPRLEFIGRSFYDPNILEWKLWNAPVEPDTTNFVVTDAGTSADHVPVENASWAATYVPATVTNVVASGDGSYTIQVFEMGDESRAQMAAHVMSYERTNDRDVGWMQDAFVDHRLVYTAPDGAAVTNVGPAEVNLAMQAYGGVFKLNHANNASGSFANVEQGNYALMADGVLQTNFWAYKDSNNNPQASRADTNTVVMFERHCEFESAATTTNKNKSSFQIVPFHGVGTTSGDDTLPLWNTNSAPIAIRRLEWMSAPSNFSGPSVSAITSVVIRANHPLGNEGGAYTNMYTCDGDFAAAKGSVYRVPMEDRIANRVALVDMRTTKKVNGVNAHELMLSEFALFGAPVTTNGVDTAPQVVSIERSDTQAALPTNAVFRIAFDRTVRYHGPELLKPTADEQDFNTSALSFGGSTGTLRTNNVEFTARRLSDTDVEVVVTGLSGDGDAALVVGGGFAWTPGGVGNIAATGATMHFDATPPAVAQTTTDFSDGAHGILRFCLDLSEAASGIDLGRFTLTGNASAELLSLENTDGTNYVVTARVTGGNAGDTVGLQLKTTVLTDLAGNTNTVSATWNAYTLTNATSDAVATVTLAAGTGGGTVSPLGTVAAVNGAVSATATPNAGFEFAGWSFAPTPPSVVPTTAEASFSGLADGTTITANFSPIGSVSVTATVSGSGGKASWIGTITLPKGGSTNVVFTAENGYQIASVQTNGVAVSGNEVSLNNLQSDVTVTVTFEKKPNAITITVKEDNVQTSKPTIDYNANWSQTFAKADKVIDSLTVNGAAQPAAVGAASYTLQLFGVIENTTVEVTYTTEAPSVEGVEFGTYVIVDGPAQFTAFSVDGTTATATLSANIEDTGTQTQKPLYAKYETALGSGSYSYAAATVTAQTAGEPGSVTFTFTVPAGNSLFLVGLSNENGSSN